MTWSLVQATGVAQDISTAAPAYDDQTSEHNLLLVWANSNDPAESFPITTGGQGAAGWSLLASFGVPYNWNGLWAKLAPSEGSGIPPEFSDSGYTVTAGACEFSGNNTTAAAADSLGTTDESGDTTASSADVVPGDLVVALTVWNGSNENPTFSQAVTGSNGSALSPTEIQGNSGATSPPFYLFTYSVNDSSLGSDDNEVVSSISEFENAPAQLIASFKPAS